MIEKCIIKHHLFNQWTGSPITNTYGGKAVLYYKGRPLFAELLALNLYKELGFEGVWVDTYSRKFRVGLPENTLPVQLPPEVAVKLQEIVTTNKSSKGVWDLLLWKDGELKFVELKRKKKDAIRQTQITFLNSAIKCGYHLDQFEILEWDIDISEAPFEEDPNQLI